MSRDHGLLKTIDGVRKNESFRIDCLYKLLCRNHSQSNCMHSGEISLVAFVHELYTYEKYVSFDRIM